MTNHKPRRVLWARGPLLAVGLLLGLPLAVTAHAGYTTCTTDPIVLLSNGRQVSMQATISDTVADVKAIAFTLRVPSGVSVTKVSYSDTTFPGRETVSVLTNAPTGMYVSTVTVTTGVAKVPVVAQTTLQGSSTSGAGTISWSVSGSASGTSGRTLRVALTHA